MKNTNQAVIWMLTRRMVATNRARNIFVILAVMLTTILVTTVFGIGSSYLASFRLQQLRLMGTLAHAAITSPTPQQVEAIGDLSYVKTTGTGRHVASLQSVDFLENLVATLYWYDEQEWKSHRKPSAVSVTGTYPTRYEEIMVPLWMLREMGIDEPTIGMQLPLAPLQPTTGKPMGPMIFTLSGWYEDYVSIRSGNHGAMFVSTAYAQAIGGSVQESGVVSVQYAVSNARQVEPLNERLRADVGLNPSQQIKTVPMYENNASTTMVVALAAMILFILLCGYLLIYNVLQISVAKDVSWYGLLKTIGTTGRQLVRLVVRQALLLAMVGIPLGLLIGSLVSFVAIPLALEFLSVEIAKVVSFHPFVFAGAAIFALLTTLVGALKPALVAAGLSPIRALHYSAVSPKAIAASKRTTGTSIFSMAFRNVFREPKRAFIVLLSLFMGITTFVSLSTMVRSMDSDSFIQEYLENDIVMENSTLLVTGSGGSRQQVFTTAVLAELNDIREIETVRIEYLKDLTMTYRQDIFASHLEHLSQRLGEKLTLDMEFLETGFYGMMIGIDPWYVQKYVQSTGADIDLLAFEQGTAVLVGTNHPEDFAGLESVELDLQDGRGKQVFPVAGFVKQSFHSRQGGLAPNVYLAANTLQQLVPDVLVSRVLVEVAEGTDEAVLQQIDALIGSDRRVGIQSKFSQRAMLKDAKLILTILGGGLSLVLGAIGMLNFANVIMTGILVRRHELAVLKSIGMTRSQVNRMLVYEGLWYAMLTTVLVTTLGSAITYGLFRLFKTQATYAVFSYPVQQILILLLMIFAICLVVPLLVSRRVVGENVVESLRRSAE